MAFKRAKERRPETIGTIRLTADAAPDGTISATVNIEVLDADGEPTDRVHEALTDELKPDPEQALRGLMQAIRSKAEAEVLPEPEV